MCYGLGQSAPALPSLVLVGSMPAALVLPQDSGCFERGVLLPRVPAAPVTRTGSSATCVVPSLCACEGQVSLYHTE